MSPWRMDAIIIIGVIVLISGEIRGHTVKLDHPSPHVFYEYVGLDRFLLPLLLRENTSSSLEPRSAFVVPKWRGLRYHDIPS